ncbi:MAG: FtsX-like permease family protein [Cyclobacteriaceae bacterium]|nr:ABC transporter permease [Cyclobacteriaceae bacterium]
MILHYLKTALRNLFKFGTYSIINIIGLVVGFACFVLISMYVVNELSFDRYHAKGERIYRLGLGSISESKMVTCISSGAMPFTLKEAYSGIENVVRFKQLPSLIAQGDDKVFEEQLFFTDSTFFQIFSNELLVGDPSTALSKPYSMVLTESLAKRFFGKADQQVLGKLFVVDETMTYAVTGVIADPPANSHFHFNILASISSLLTHPQESVRTYQLESWYSHYYHNYLLLEEGADPLVVADNILKSAKLYSDPVYYERFGSDMGLFLQPLYEIHLNPLRGELEEQGDSMMLSVLAAVALVVLVLASINYTNIATAQSTNRVKEVGIRKTMGATRMQMVIQYLGESFLVNCVSMFLAIGLVDLMIPYFNQITGSHIAISVIQSTIILIIVSAVLLTTILGGLYPALVLGRYSPIQSLKKVSLSLPGRIGLRRVIVVFQFAVCVILVGGSFLIYSQVQHMLDKDLGLSTEHVIVIPTRGDPSINSRISSFFERLSLRSEIQSYSISELSPGDAIYGIVASFEGGDVRNYLTTGIDYGYLDTYKINLLAGRNFSKDQPLDTVERVIINETMAKVMGWTAEEAIGKRYDQEGDGVRVGEVIGVTGDFQFNSLRENVPPIVMGLMPYFYQKVSVRLMGDLNRGVEVAKEAWLDVYPNRPFDFYFADDTVQQLYVREKRFGGLFMFFAIVSSGIGLLGLFGIASLELKFRTKEIGIRKVLGASLTKLLMTLSQDFLKLTVIAFVISVPISYYLMNYWLQGFTYRVDSVWTYIVVPGVLVIAVAALVVVWRTLRAASVNPVETLRNE